MNAYSYLKPFRHPDILHSIQTAAPVRPAHVELILADLCQQHCNFCAYRIPGYASNQLFDDRRMMAIDKALEIIDDCAAIGVQAVQFTGGGEPTLHKGFRAAISRAQSHGATEETYCKMRRVHQSHWDKAQSAISRLRAHRDLAGTTCQIGVGFVVTPDNWREIYDAARLAKALGADNFRISAQFSNEDEKLFAGFHAECAKLCAEAEGLSDAGFKVYNRFGDRIEDLRFGAPEHSLCGYQFYAYNDRGLVGSIANQRFKDFWLSQERFDNQMNFDSRGCERCQFRKQNSALAYALSPEPQMHEEFV